MVQSQIDIPEREDKMLKVLKAKIGFSNKSEAIVFLINEHGKRENEE